MSDPVTNIDIEDVLSSIRRLVSDGGDVPAPRSAPAEATRDRLVLTPALRVHAGAPESAASDQQDDTSATVSPSMPDAQPAEPSAAEPSAAMAETGTDAPPADPVAADPVAADPVAGDDTLMAAVDRSSLEARIAELEAAVTRQPDDWEPDGSEDVPVIDWATAELTDAAFFSGRAPGVLRLDTAAEDAEELEGPASPAGQPPPTASHDPAAQAAAAADDIAGDDAAGGEASGHDAGNAPEIGSEDVADGLSDDLAGGVAFDGEVEEELTAYLEEESLIDEDMLRALVVEIVRQELQGTLGERITRNVRKLVRREIYRVLASEEFD